MPPAERRFSIAAWVKSGCSSCDGAGSTAFGQALAGAGIAYYAVLLAIAIGFGPTPVTLAGILVAGGTHGALLGILILRDLWCPPCFATGAAAILATLVTFFLSSENLVRAIWILPGIGIAWNTILVFVLGVAPQATPELIPRELAREETGPSAIPVGHIRLTVYSRPDCRYCQELKDDIMPDLRREFGPELRVIWRSAEEFPGPIDYRFDGRGPRPGSAGFTKDRRSRL